MDYSYSKHTVKREKVPLIKRAAMILLVLSPILSIYGNVSGWNYFAIASVVLGLFYLLFNNGFKQGKLPTLLILYLVYWSIILFLTSFILPLSIIQIFITFTLFWGCFNLNYYLKLYKFIGFVCILFFIYQYVVYITTGVHVSGILPGVPLNIDNLDAFQSVMERSTRCYSFFSEPSHFAMFLLPLYSLELLYDKAKYHYHYAALIVVVLLLLQSGNGIIGLIVASLFFIPQMRAIYKSSHNKSVIVLISILITTFVAFSVPYYLNSEIGTSVTERQDELSMSFDGAGSMSGFLRVWRGYFVYNDYSLIEKILGNPNPFTLKEHIANSGMSMGILNETYFNALQNILLKTGVVGLVMFSFLLRGLWKKCDLCGKSIIAILIAFCFTSSIYFTVSMAHLLVIANSLKYNKYE